MFHCSLSDSFRLCRDSKAGDSGLLIYGSFQICFITAKQLKGLASTLLKKKKTFSHGGFIPAKSFREICQTLRSHRMTVLCVSSSVSSIKTLSKMMLIYYKCHSLMGRGVLWKHFGGTNPFILCFLSPYTFIFSIILKKKFCFSNL